MAADSTTVAGRFAKYLEVGKAAHVKNRKDVQEALATSFTEGLTEEECDLRVEALGKNELKQAEGKSILELIYEQFEDLLVRILLGAAVISFLLALVEGGEEGISAYVEPLVILIILVLNAAVGVWQESNAEKALDALKQLQPELARVCRGGSWKTILSALLVPGDLIDIRSGDKVPADCRIIGIKSTSLRLEQSQLTGESETVFKEEVLLPGDRANCEIQEKRNILFSSTTVVNGRAQALVVATGMNTEIGKIQAAVVEASTEEEQTPLQKKLDEFGEALSKAIFGICVVVWVINIGHFNDPVHGGLFRGCVYYFKIAVALAVAAIPEGLPAVITTCLALGTRKMAKRNAIVRKIQSVETLGCTSVICSDKTGTLTTNEMTVVKLCVPRRMNFPQALFSIEGTTYSPCGRVMFEGEQFKLDRSHVNLHWLSRCACLCNEASLEAVQVGKVAKFNRMGEPTEASLLVMVEKLGCLDEELVRTFWGKAERDVKNPTPFCKYWEADYETKAVLEFTRDRKSMSVLAEEAKTGVHRLFVKGAPEGIIERCCKVMLMSGKIVYMTWEMREEISKMLAEQATCGLRTLAFAMREDINELVGYHPDLVDHPAHMLLQNPSNFAEIESEMIYLGFVGIIDPPRPEVEASIKHCMSAGIRVIMITGDNQLTAEAIARKVKIKTGEGPFYSGTGKEFEALPLEKKKAVLAKGNAVFSRTEPKHKQMIVKLLKEMGEITAMTGDGVNDAPALKQADIGVAMGLTGTEVAKEAADMVLADDNFSTIVSAVEEGRSIYNNMKAFIRYLISSNIGEVASIFLTAALGIPEGLSPVQLLWVNLVTDGPPATALGFNPPDTDVMDRPPRNKDDNLTSVWILFRYIIVGVYVGIATVGIFVWWFCFGTTPGDTHTLVSFSDLANWNKCRSWPEFQATPVFDMKTDDPCSYFTAGKVKASTLSLTVLVVIEMLNAFNALSENNSLSRMPPWTNPYLVLATITSIGVHCIILYTPLCGVFGVVPLEFTDWLLVLLFAMPVIGIDEALKFWGRELQAGEKKKRLTKIKGN